MDEAQKPQDARLPIQRSYVIRPDGKPISVPRQKGQIFYCQQGCCCGKTERGFAEVPRQLYSDEWKRRKLRNRVHLNRAGCLGPCALANVVLLVYEGRPVWFHSVNSPQLIVAIFDYVESMLQADRYLPPPSRLASYVFNGFSWDGQSMQDAAEPPPRSQQAWLSLQEREILILTHADTDLLTLSQAVERLPAGFPPVRGVHLSELASAELAEDFLRRGLKRAQVLVLRSWGGRQGFAHAFERFAQAAREKGLDFICVPGSEGLDPELTAYSNVPVPVIHDLYRYLHFGGVANFEQMLRFLSDHLLAGGWGYELPAEQPRHGIYHPRFGLRGDEGPDGLQAWLASRNADRPSIGLLFYRSHWLSGNTDFVDRLIEECESAGAEALPVFTSSLKESSDDGSMPAAFRFLYDPGSPQSRALIDALLCTISFAMGGIERSDWRTSNWGAEALEELDVPVIQAITASISQDEWRISPRGLPPLDVAMNVALPEFDGRIIGPVLSFKEEAAAAEGAGGCRVRAYRTLPDRARAAAGLALRLAALRRKPNREKRVAVILTNSPGKADRIGNAVGLDSGASLMRLLARMDEEGYAVENLPPDADSLMHGVIEQCTYDEDRLSDEQLRKAPAKVATEHLARWFQALSESQREKICGQWGEPPGEAFVHFDRQGRALHQAIAGLELGNVFVALQPPRGYGMDPDAIYHKPDLAPPHYYYALYRWLNESRERGGWGADALIHVGKHGTLEWLPGKSVGLGSDCFPEAFLGPLPVVYPFIINNPGEGAQAKRRTHAVIVDHMIPPMTSADVYGDLAQLTQLVDEYYRVEQLDPSKLPLLQQQIWELMQRAQLDKDLEEMMRYVDHGDHKHIWDGSVTDEGTPLTLAQMKGTDFAHLLEDIDGYLCELGSLQIRDGLHVLGDVPEGEQLCSLLNALTRVPNGAIPSLRRAVSSLMGFELDELLDAPGRRLGGKGEQDAPREIAQAGPGDSPATRSDVLEQVDLRCLQILSRLEAAGFEAEAIPAAIEELPERPGAPSSPSQVLASPAGAQLEQVLRFVCEELAPRIDRCGEEISAVLHALQGGHVEAGPAGSPTRGMAQILPTGRNFYAVDPRAVPSPAAWTVGCRLADQLIERYRREEGEYPQCVGISIWGTSAMRTQGDDIAQCLALLGIRPLWQAESRRISGLQPIPWKELGRPRIDVVMRISGFFRDAFPHLIELLDQAVRMAAELDEPSHRNFVRRRYQRDLKSFQASGMEGEQARKTAGFRLFGCKPGTYGAGILPLIQEGNWQDASDFAQAYVNWGGYAYGQGAFGDDARDRFRHALAEVGVAVKNQDNREHDIFDSDDYLQYHGGMIAAIRSLSGRDPKSYFGDSSDPERADVRSLKEESMRVFRSRVVNPKWLRGIRRHGYKGAVELASTIDYLFGYDATAGVVDDWMYEKAARTYALEGEMQEFFLKSNPWALQSVSERLLEAAERGLWQAPDPETLQGLRQAYRRAEGHLEGPLESSGPRP